MTINWLAIASALDDNWLAITSARQFNADEGNSSAPLTCTAGTGTVAWSTDVILFVYRALWQSTGYHSHNMPNHHYGYCWRIQMVQFQANTEHLYNICTMLAQRRRRWANVVQMLYKCFAFAGIVSRGTGNKCIWPHNWTWQAVVKQTFLANTRRWTNGDLMLAQSRRRWVNIKSTLVQCLFACLKL